MSDGGAEAASQRSAGGAPVRAARPPVDPGAERPPLQKPGQLDSRLVHEGRVVHLSMERVRFPDGSTGELELVRHSGASAVLPVLDDGDAGDPLVLLLRQYRYATGGELIEVPAGRPDDRDEPWIDVAHRELEEETGYRAGSLEYLGAIWTTPGFTDEKIHLYLARDLQPGTRATDEDEFIEPIRMHLSQAVAAILDGRITDAKSICTLLIAARRFRPASAP